MGYVLQVAFLRIMNPVPTQSVYRANSSKRVGIGTNEDTFGQALT